MKVHDIDCIMSAVDRVRVYMLEVGVVYIVLYQCTTFCVMDNGSANTTVWNVGK
jgi:hypothetical protein